MVKMYNDLVEDISCYEFQKFFYEKNESSKLEFLSTSLQDCLNRVITEKKPLVFVVHDKANSNSYKLCELLTTPEIEDLVNEKFLILGWQITNQEYYDRLAEKIIIINEVFTHLKDRKSGVFIIIPVDETVLVYKKIINTDEDFTTDNDSGDNAENNTFNNDPLFSDLTQVEQLLGLYSYNNFTKNLTSTKYQQMIYDELGDRDFDSFESNQHKFLKDKISFALYGPPKQLEDGDIGYEPKQMEEIETLYDKIRNTNNKYSKWNDRIVITFIYNCTEPLAQEKDKKKREDENYNPDNDFGSVPVIVLRKCKKNKKENNGKSPCRVFIDSSGRVYQSWDLYLQKNVLPPCKMIYPKDGKYQSKLGSSNVLLHNKPSPSSSGIFKFMQAADIGSGIIGFVSGVTLIASAFTPAAAVTVPAAIATGIATGAYATGRSVHTLRDRNVHEQSINITNAESRGAYLNIAAGVASVIGAGATKTVSTLVGSGATVGPVVEGSITLINTANLAIGGTAFINTCYDVGSQYYEDGVVPSALTIAQLGSSLFFFGNSIYNFRTGAALVKEIQTTTLNEINDGLRSNRHRKTFNKMLKETVRIKGEAQGRAEVITTLRNSASRDDILAVLTRSNKNFNKNNVRFAAEGGGITLNGVKVDILEFGTFQKTQQSATFNNLPQIPENHESISQHKTTNLVENSQLFKRINGLIPTMVFDSSTALNMLLDFTQPNQTKILNICEKFINRLHVDFILDLRQLCTEDVRIKIMQYVIDFIKQKCYELKRRFEIQLLSEDVTTVCRQFGFQNPHVTISNFIDLVIKKLLGGNMMDELLNTFYSWFTHLTYEKEQKIETKNERHKQNPEKKNQKCSVCGGYYYI